MRKHGVFIPDADRQVIVKAGCDMVAPRSCLKIVGSCTHQRFVGNVNTWLIKAVYFGEIPFQ